MLCVVYDKYIFVCLEQLSNLSYFERVAVIVTRQIFQGIYILNKSLVLHYYCNKNSFSCVFYDKVLCVHASVQKRKEGGRCWSIRVLQ